MDERAKERLRIMSMSRDRVFLPPTTPVSRRRKMPEKHEFENALTHLLHHSVDTHLHPKHEAHYKNILHHVIGESGDTRLKDETSDRLNFELFGDKGKDIANLLRGNKQINDALKKLDAKPQTSVVKEPLELHKYGALAESAYTHYQGGDPHDTLKGHFLDELNDFEMDTELSTIDNLVLHNPITGETHVAYRGTQKLSDWKTNLQAMSSVEEHSPLVKSAIKTAQQVADKYGSKNMSVSGHSMGGMRSLAVAQHFGDKGIHIQGYHFDPGVSVKQLMKHGKYSKLGTQQIFRTHFDTPSVVAKMAQIKPPKGVKITNVLTNPEHAIKIPGLDQHSTNHFNIKNPVGFAEDGSILVKRDSVHKVVADALRSGEQGIEVIANSKVGKVAKPLLHYGSKIAEKAAMPLAVLGTGLDVYEDITDPNKSLTQKETDIGVDVASGVGAWTAGNIAGDLAMGATLAICPECALLSVGAGLLTGGAVGYAVEEVGGAIKKPTEKVIGAVEDFAEDVGSTIADTAVSVEKGVVSAAESVGKGVVTAAKDVGSAAKSFGHWLGF